MWQKFKCSLPSFIQVKLKVIKTDMSQPVPYILGSFLGLVGANDKAPDAIDSPVQIVEPSQWPQAVASGVLPSTPSKESPKPKQKRAPAKKAAATAAQPAQNGLPQVCSLQLIILSCYTYHLNFAGICQICHSFLGFGKMKNISFL